MTVVCTDSGPTLRERIIQLARAPRTPAIVGAVLAIVLAIAAVGALVVGPWAHDGNSGGGGPGPQAHGPAGVAAAYGYPRRCLAITISRADMNYARADLEHAGSCWRYRGNVIAVFHRVEGAWRTLFRASGYSCPVTVLPTAVQADLAVCPQTTGPLGLV